MDRGQEPPRLTPGRTALVGLAADVLREKG